MNPLLAIIAVFESLRAEITTKFNAALKSVPPVEMVEGAMVANNLIRELDWTLERLKRDGEEIQATIQAAGKKVPGFVATAGESLPLAAARLLETIEVNSAAEAINAGVAAKTIVLHADHDTAIITAKETAKQEGRTEAETDFKAEVKKIELLATRRTDAVTRLGSLAAARITDEVLLADDFETTLTAVEGRLATLKEKNITAEAQPKVYESLIAHLHNDASFTTTLDVMLEAAGGSFAAAASTKPAPPRPSEKTGAPLDATGEKKKRVI